MSPLTMGLTNTKADLVKLRVIKGHKESYDVQTLFHLVDDALYLTFLKAALADV